MTRTRRSSALLCWQPWAPSMRVALFLPSLGGGGAERVMVSLARGFAARGLEVDLVLVQAEGPYMADVPRTVRVVELGARKVMLSLPALVRYLRRERPAVLLSTLNVANVIAVWAGRLARTSTKTVVRQAAHLSRDLADQPNASSRLIAWSIRRSYPLATAVVAVSEGVKLDLAQSSGIRPDHIRVVPNPVVTAELFEKARAPIQHSWFAEGAPPVVLGIGRLTTQKDFVTLVRAFAVLRARRDARLMILGEGPERATLERLASDLGVADDLALPGFVDNPFAYLKRAALFVLSSTFEGLPGALIQALACDTPVVATDCDSGPREILQGGRFGALVPVANVSALGDAMYRTLEHPPAKTPAEALNRFTDAGAVDAYLRALELDVHA
jgi:glycosyltransferase involved in cell wall biosynthesis